MPGERSDRHGVVAVVLAGGRADVGVGVDPDDGEVVAVAPGQRRERRHADGAVAPQGEDAGGIVLRDQAQRVVQLGEHGVLRLDAAARGLTDRLRAQGAELACVGIGISNAAHVATALEYADGAIVGTAFVRALRDGGIAGLAAVVEEIACGTGRAPDPER